MSDNPLIIIGASARAAAFSAHRAGYTPYWLDQFGDTDLGRQFPGRIISPYPRQAVELIENAPDAPFIYTGALENHPGVLERLCRRRTLLGNPARACPCVKDPFRLYELFQRNGIRSPEVRPGDGAPVVSGDWLRKPLRSAGGIGIRRHRGGTVSPGYILQQYLPGESYSAVFVAGPGDCRLLGVTRQLVGLSEFHAGEFNYCGSIGPLGLDDAEDRQWRRLGEVIGAECNLKGLFGVDAIKRQDGIYPVEVNPRYTASVEVLELALGCRAIKLHCDACNNRSPYYEKTGRGRLIGKAVLFAPADLKFTECAGKDFSIADIPAPGTAIKHGQPILTVLVDGNSVGSIMHSLKRAAGSIYKSLGVKYEFTGSE